MPAAPAPPATDLLQAWADADALADPATRTQLATLVDAQAEALADLFYDAMLADRQAGPMLDHALVNQRLHASMARWCRSLFSTTLPAAELLALQQRTGEVHARIGVPMRLVSRGARLIRRAIWQRLVERGLTSAQLLGALDYVNERIDLALDAMHGAFVADAQRYTRTDEAYRLFFLGQNMKTERERRRSDLLEWSQQQLLRGLWDTPGDDPAPGSSQFGLWLQHKAGLLFDGAAEVALMQAELRRVEQQLVPQLAGLRGKATAARAQGLQITQATESIKTMLAALFDRFVDMEDGRDAVTRTLHRRYFAPVARREVALAIERHSAFALLLLDLDHFGRIGQTLGQEAGNLVLAQVAELLADQVRAGDFVFRFGDDQFLLLLVELRRDAAMRVAEGLRQRIASLSLRTGSPVAATLTASIGVAVFDGHPDFQRLLDRAEAALQAAKRAGRNRSMLA